MPYASDSQFQFCSRCGEQLSMSANFCQRCATPVNPQPPIAPVYQYTPQIQPRKVGLALGIGIFLLPYIFAWFTLRKGHTNLSRTISFIWLGTMVFAIPRSENSRDVRPATTTSISTQTTAPQVVNPKEQALSQIRIDVRWSTGGFGSVMLADFSVSNSSPYPVKDLEVTCTHFANSGTQIDSNTQTIYEVVPAKGKKVVRDFNMGFIHSQATSTSCKVTDLTIL